jgi:hypothetical protein
MIVGEEQDIGRADSGTGLFDGDCAHDRPSGLSDGLGESSPGQHGRAEGGIERGSDAGRDKKGVHRRGSSCWPIHSIYPSCRGIGDLPDPD